MARTAQRLAIIGAITASIIGYLYYAPGIEDMAQTNRIRALGATMKITQFVVCNFVFTFYFLLSFNFAGYSG
jgi:glycerol uptake facilitator-like aquaporin